jgi:Carboxypeptidase regulatory-like domain
VKKHSNSAKFASFKACGAFLLALVMFAIPSFAWPAANPQATTASIAGKVTVRTIEGSVNNLAGITVKLTGPAPETTSRTELTDADGHYEFTHLAPGSYTTEARLEGFDPWIAKVTLSPGQAAVLDASLQINTISEQLEVKAEATDIATESVSATSTVSEKQLDALPLRTQELAEALSFSPSVIRTHEGKLNFNGQTESQGMMLVDSAENVDPVAGSFAIPIPSGVIQSIQVYNTPDSAEFGGFSGGLTRIELKSPPQAWAYKVMDFIPAFRAKQGSIIGIANMTPRLEFGGPIVANKYTFFEDLTYEFRRDPVRGLSWPFNETYRRSFISFTQFQATLSPRHVMNLNVNFFPQNLQFININSLVPQSASVDYRRRGVSAGVSDSYQFESGVILNTVVRYTRFDSSTYAQGPADMEITPEGWGGNFFNNWARKANQFEALPSLQLPTKSWLGRHDLKFGTDVLYRTYGGDSVSHPIQIRAEDGSRVEQIDFQGAGLLRATSEEISEFAEDHWTLTSNFSINFGGRVTSQSIGRSLAFAPRGGLAYSLRGGKTVLRAGAGVLYGHVPLLAAGFADNQERVISMYNSGTLAGPPVTLVNLYVPAGATASSPGSQDPSSTPRTLTWNAEGESAVSRTISVRIGYLDSRTRDLFIVDPMLPAIGTVGVLALTNTGTSQYRQAELTAHYRPSERADVNLTYVWSRARGDLNALTDTFVPFQSPVIRPNAYGISSSDIPQRVIAGALVHLPWWKLIVSPVADVHSGFPYSPLDVLQNYAAVPNSARFPMYFSLDAKIYRDIVLHLPFLDSAKGRKIRVGVFSLNATNHQNFHDVFYNRASPLYGTFAGNQRRFTGFVLGLGE